jgi:hypothetical protein
MLRAARALWATRGNRGRTTRPAVHRIAAHIGHLKGDAYAYLTDPNYNTLRLRLELAHAAVEARRRVRLNEGDRHH